MKKMICVILGLVLLALGLLGITGAVPTFKTDYNYVNIVEIAIGTLGFVYGIYARRGTKYSAQKIILSQKEIDIDRQKKEIDSQKKEIEQQKIEINQQKMEIEQQKKVSIEQSAEK